MKSETLYPHHRSITGRDRQHRFVRARHHGFGVVLLFGADAQLSGSLSLYDPKRHI
jgi:hypothetical protein